MHVYTLHDATSKAIMRVSSCMYTVYMSRPDFKPVTGFSKIRMARFKTGQVLNRGVTYIQVYNTYMQLLIHSHS